MSTDTFAHRTPRSSQSDDEPVFLAIDDSEESADPAVLDTAVAADRTATVRRPSKSADLGKSAESGAEEIVFAAADPELADESTASPAAGDVVAERPAWLTPKGRSGDAGVEPTASAVPASPAARAAKPAPRRKGKKGAEPLIPIVAKDEPEEVLPWPERIKQWVVGFAAMGYGLSLIVHVVLMMALSLIITAPKLLNRPASLTAMQDDGLDTRIVDIGMGEEEEAGGAPDAPTVIETAQVTAALDALKDQEVVMEPDFPSDIVNGAQAPVQPTGPAGKGNGTGGAEGDGKGLFTTKPGGGKVVTKGRFSAWTKPEDPMPGQPYRIYIQIELPSKIVRLPKGDLAGSNMVGTDRFQIDIAEGLKNRHPGTRLRANGKQVQVEVFVPGASADVRDTIFIKSKLLNEEQTIELVF